MGVSVQYSLPGFRFRAVPVRFECSSDPFKTISEQFRAVLERYLSGVTPLLFYYEQFLRSGGDSRVSERFRCSDLLSLALQCGIGANSGKNDAQRCRLVATSTSPAAVPCSFVSNCPRIDSFFLNFRDLLCS